MASHDRLTRLQQRRMAILFPSLKPVAQLPAQVFSFSRRTQATPLITFAQRNRIPMICIAIVD